MENYSKSNIKLEQQIRKWWPQHQQWRMGKTLQVCTEEEWGEVDVVEYQDAPTMDGVTSYRDE